MKQLSFVKLLISVLLLISSWSMVEAQTEVRVTFEVQTSVLPDSATVYVTGNLPELGSWQPDGVALQRQTDSLWTTTLTFPTAGPIEYKFTLGTWEREAVDSTGAVPDNYQVTVNRDTTLAHVVPDWGSSPEHVAFEGGITGEVRYHRGFAGDSLLARDIIVWLPPGYETDSTATYPVIYMHDGQNLFDPTTSFTGIDWQADETADSLIQQDKMEPVIIVGIANTANRSKEYLDTPTGEHYRHFVIEQLKPFIDSTYRTRPEREFTATIGSSAGGLVAFLLAWKHPDTFSMAGCLSPAFLIGKIDAVRLVTEHQEPPPDIFLYIDNGGVDLEAQLQPGCEAMLEALTNAGFVMDENLVWYHDPEAAHHESAWAERLWRPFVFMFGQ